MAKFMEIMGKAGMTIKQDHSNGLSAKRILIINKYATLQENGEAGTRSAYLAEEFAKNGHSVRLLFESSAINPSSDSCDLILDTKQNLSGQLETIALSKRKANRGTVSRVISWIVFEVKVIFACRVFKVKPDVVIASIPSPLTILSGLVIKYLTGAKLVYEIRDVWPDSLISYSKISQKNPAVKFLSLVNKIGIFGSNLVIGTMPNISQLVNGYRNNVPVGTIPIGFRDVKRNALVEDEKTLENWPSEKMFTIGYAGSMGKSNELETLLRVAERFQLTKPNVRFVLIGDGECKLKIEEQFKGLTNTIFYPRVSRKVLRDFLVKCEVLYAGFHNVSVFRYGQSLNKIVEYMSCGRPVVLSYSGFPSMINEANCGLIASAENVDELEDAFWKLISMPKCQRDSMGLSGKQWVEENRSYDKLARDYLNFMENIL